MTLPNDEAESENSRPNVVNNLVSIVVPACDEAANLAELHRQLDSAAAEISKPIEFIFIDDGSTDETWRRLSGIADLDRRVSALRFRRNFGKSAALAAGFARAQGSVIVSLDGDLQDDPAELPRLLAELDRGYDMVVGWKKRRNDPSSKRLPSKLFNFVVSRLTGVSLNDHNSGYKCFRRAVADEVDLYGDFHRFLAVFAAARGFSIGEIPVNHRPRTAGRSKFGAGRYLRGFADALAVKFLVDYRDRPQHLFIGLAAITVGLAFATWIISYIVGLISGVVRYFTGAVAVDQSGTSALTATLLGALVFAALFTAFGLLSALIRSLKPRDQSNYAISELRIGDPSSFGGRKSASGLGLGKAKRLDSVKHGNGASAPNSTIDTYDGTRADAAEGADKRYPKPASRNLGSIPLADGPLGERPSDGG